MSKLQKKRKPLPIWVLRLNKESLSLSSKLRKDRLLRERHMHTPYKGLNARKKKNVFESKLVYCPDSDRVYYYK